MEYRGLVAAVSIACAVALTPALAAADASATLTVPAQVQTAAGASPMIQPSFSYPEATPFCTVGVDFTWDGGNWLTEFPNKNGALCVATGINMAAPDGHGGAGAHEVCASAGPRFKDCKQVTVVVTAGKPAPASANPAAPAAQPPSQAAPAAIPSDAPAPRIVTRTANRLPPESRVAGLVLLAAGVMGLLLVLGRRVLLRRRRRPTPLPTPGGRR